MATTRHVIFQRIYTDVDVAEDGERDERDRKAALVRSHRPCPCGCNQCRECEDGPWTAEHVVDLLDA